MILASCCRPPLLCGHPIIIRSPGPRVTQSVTQIQRDLPHLGTGQSGSRLAGVETVKEQVILSSWHKLWLWPLLTSNCQRGPALECAECVGWGPWCGQCGRGDQGPGGGGGDTRHGHRQTVCQGGKHQVTGHKWLQILPYELVMNLSGARPCGCGCWRITWPSTVCGVSLTPCAGSAPGS